MTKRPIDLLCIDTSRRIGGGGVSIERLLVRLDPKRVRPTFACPSKSALGDRIAGRGIAILPWVPTSRSQRIGRWDPLAGGVLRRVLLPFATALSAVRLTAWLRARPSGVLHANTFQAAVLAALVAVIARRPLIIHDRILKKHGVLERWAWRRADLILTASRGGAEKWGTLFERKTRQLADGPDPATFRPAGDRSLRSVHGAADSDFVIVTVGRLTREKRFELLIEAASPLRKETLLWIVGEPCLPEDERYLDELKEQAVRLGVRARFLGFVADVRPLLEAGDLFVLPTPREQYGQVILEAMLMARPVVASRAFGPAEIIEDGVTGRLFTPNDAGDLARRLAEMAADRARREAMGRTAREVAERRYSLERTLEEFTRIVEFVAR